VRLRSRDEARPQRDVAERSQVAERLTKDQALAAADAERQARQDAQSRQYAARALLRAESNPVEALELAARAGELGDNPDSEAALRRAIRGSHLEAVLTHVGGTTDAEMAGDRVVTVGQDSRIRLWEAATGRLGAESREVEGNRSVQLRGVAVSPDARRAVVWGGLDGVGLWDLVSRRELHRFRTFDQVVFAGFSPDGSRVLTAHGASVSLRRTDDGADVRRVSGTTYTDAAMTPDGTMLAAGSNDGRRAELWDALTGTTMGSVRTGGPVRKVAISADGKWLAAVSDVPAPASGFKLWNIADPKRPTEYDRLRLDVIDVRVSCARFFPKRLALVTGSSDGVVRVWKGRDNGEWELVSSLRGHSGSDGDLAVSGSANRVASVGEDGTVRLWIPDPGDIVIRGESWHPLSLARGHSGGVRKVRFSVDGQRVVTIGRDGTAMLWDTQPDREVGTAGPVFHPVERVLVDPAGTRAVLFGHGIPYMFSSRDGKLVEIGSGGPFGVFYSGIDLSPDGRSLLVDGPGNETTVYDVATGKQRGVQSPSGGVTRLASADKARHVAREHRTATAGHLEDVTAEAVSPDRSRLVIGTKQGTVSIVDTTTGTVLSAIHDHTAEVTSIVFSRGGNTFATASADGTARLYALRVRDLVALARSRLPRRDVQITARAGPR
jgi:WD40 repeat protein